MLAFIVVYQVRLISYVVYYSSLTTYGRVRSLLLIFLLVPGRVCF